MRITRTAAIALALVLAAGLGACGGSPAPTKQVASVKGVSDASDDEEAEKKEIDPEDAPFEFAKCMRENGIEDFPDPEIKGEGMVMMGGARIGEGVDEEEMQAAHEACEHILRDGGPMSDLTPEQKAEMQDQMLKFAACMRGHGIDMPDPNTDGGIIVERRVASEGEGQVSSSGPDIDPEDPGFQAAQEACQDLIRPPDGVEGGPSFHREEGAR